LDPDLKGSHFHEDPVWMEFADDAREALALAQAETQPVAWLHPTANWSDTDYDVIRRHCLNDGPMPVPLFASHVPAKREAGETWYRWRGPKGGWIFDTKKPSWPCEVVRVALT